jgi:hypothetical protein
MGLRACTSMRRCLTHSLSLLQRLSITKSASGDGVRKLSNSETSVSSAMLGQGLGTPNAETTKMARLWITTSWNRRLASMLCEACIECRATLNTADRAASETKGCLTAYAAVSRTEGGDCAYSSTVKVGLSPGIVVASSSSGLSDAKAHMKESWVSGFSHSPPHRRWMSKLSGSSLAIGKKAE